MSTRDQIRKSEPEIALRLDLRGWSCEWGILKIKSRLRELAPGQTLEVMATDPNTCGDLEKILVQGGGRLMEVIREAEYATIRIERSAG